MTSRSAKDEPLTPAERRFLLEFGAPAGSFDPAAQEAARASLRARAEATRRKASRELSADELADMRGCSTSTVHDWATSQDLYPFTTDEGLRFPEWQFADRRRVPHLRMVLAA